MRAATKLRIRRTQVPLRPRVGERSVNELAGGPQALLAWLETQLGLRRPPVDQSARVSQYLGMLEKQSNALFAESMNADRWATGARLLQMRDELMLAGWNGQADLHQPQIVQDLASADPVQWSSLGEADRLLRVLEALDAGQHLPEHRCELLDPPESWPVVWRAVLARLNCEAAQDPRPSAIAGAALESAQKVVLGEDGGTITPDESLRYVSTRSETAACEWLVRVLLQTPESLPETVVYCEDDALSLRFDACLARAGLPTMGAGQRSLAHPVLQVLPLSLALMWEPVDPQLLLDFLTLPFCPVPRRAGFRLAKSLSEQPGLGSGAWERTLAEVTNKDNDPDGKVLQRIEAWLLRKRTGRGEPLATSQVQATCGLVAQWAGGYATKLSEEQGDPDFVSAMGTASGHATLLAELVQAQGKEVTQAQLSRLYEEALGGGMNSASFEESAGGPVHVRSLAEVTAPFCRMVWLGLGTADAVPSMWSNADREKLGSAGVDLDDGSKAVTARRRAEAYGFSCVTESLLAVLLPADATRRWHPLWLAVRNALGAHPEPLRLEDVVAVEGSPDLSPFSVDVVPRPTNPVPCERALWQAPEGTVVDLETASATELQTRLACPLKWTLRYRANLHSRTVASLPSSFLLKGSFCHSVLQIVFGNGDGLPSPSEASSRAAEVFDERLPLDAAPLSLARFASERRRLRNELCRSVEQLVTALSSEGYRIVGIEVAVDATAMGKPLIGSIDCLADKPDGAEAVVDFKYAGRRKYQGLLGDGRAVQLATYAHARSQHGGPADAPISAAYLIIADAQVMTPSGSPLTTHASCVQVDGPAVADVWNRFADALGRSEGWMAGDDAVPARPLQPPTFWPTGAELVLAPDLAPGDQQECCKYCDYQVLCGIRRLS